MKTDIPVSTIACCHSEPCPSVFNMSTCILEEKHNETYVLEILNYHDLVVSRPHLSFQPSARLGQIFHRLRLAGSRGALEQAKNIQQISNRNPKTNTIPNKKIKHILYVIMYIMFQNLPFNLLVPKKRCLRSRSIKKVKGPATSKLFCGEFRQFCSTRFDNLTIDCVLYTVHTCFLVIFDVLFNYEFLLFAQLLGFWFVIEMLNAFRTLTLRALQVR